MGYYSSNPELEKKIHLKPTKANNGKFETIGELYSLLSSGGWSEESVYDLGQWNPQLKCNGQCNATALIVQEFFGGEIIEYPNPTAEKRAHFFNRIQNVDIDLTSEQFNPRLTDYSDKQIVRKCYSYRKLAKKCKVRMGL